MTRTVWTLDRLVVDLPEPWPLFAEITTSLPPRSWTLVGGLMVQAHVMHAGLAVARPTQDIDLILHIETGAISWPAARSSLQAMGFRLREPNNPRDPAHRFVRSAAGVDQVIDVLIADHAAPRAISTQIGRRNVVEAPGGTSALRKTLDLQLATAEDVFVVSLPDVLGALTLKGGAYRADSRDRERHLLDAAMLAATIDDADALLDDASRWTGSDARRIRHLADVLGDDHPAWSNVPAGLRRRAQISLRLLAGGPQPRP